MRARVNSRNFGGGMLKMGYGPAQSFDLFESVFPPTVIRLKRQNRYKYLIISFDWAGITDGAGAFSDIETAALRSIVTEMFELKGDEVCEAGLPIFRATPGQFDAW